MRPARIVLRLAVGAVTSLGLFAADTAAQAASLGQQTSPTAVVCEPCQTPSGVSSGFPTPNLGIGSAADANSASAYPQAGGANGGPGPIWANNLRPVAHGIDNSGYHPLPESLSQLGYRFDFRYLSSGPNYLLTLGEVHRLFRHNVTIGLVYEAPQGPSWVMRGYASGQADAMTAESRAHKLGVPASVALYFAIDWDAAPWQQTNINAYARGWDSVVGLSHSGGYGGYWVVKRLFNAQLVRYGWQTIAWSGGQVDPRVSVYQTSNQIFGTGADIDLLLRRQFGGWAPGTWGPRQPAAMMGRLVGMPSIGANVALGMSVKTLPTAQPTPLVRQFQLRGWGNAGYAFNFFHGHGLTIKQASGAVGNLQSESGPTVSTTAVNSTGHRGIAQWDQTRWSRLLHFAQKRHLNPLEERTQLEYILFELPRYGGRQLRKATSVASAANIFRRLYEITGQSASKRVSLARKIYTAALSQALHSQTPQASGVGSQKATSLTGLFANGALGRAIWQERAAHHSVVYGSRLNRARA